MQAELEIPSGIIPKDLLFSQDQFVYSPSKFPAIVGTWGCGKSLAMLYAANLECENHPNNLVLIIRKEFVDLRDSTMQDWNAEIGRPWDGDKNVNYENGSVLMFRHGKDIDSLKNTNLGWAGLIQAEEMTEEEFWFIVGRIRRQAGSLKVCLEANYNGHNWIYKLWKKKDLKVPLGSSITAEDFHLIETNTLENKANLPASYIASLEMLPEKLKKRHYLGSWDEAQGLVYDEFSENRHVVRPFEIDPNWEKGFVLDHGFTNPTAVLWYAIDFDGNVILYDEHYEREHPPSWHAERILQRGINSGWCDPSVFAKTQSRGANSELFSIADEYRDFGVSLSPALRGSDASGIARVNEFFKAGRIKVFSTLVNMINEMNNWKYKVITSRTLTNLPEQPDDLDNHLCLSGDTEVITHNGYQRISELDGSTFQVWTPFGWRVAKCLRTGYRPTTEILFSDGSSVCGTNEHPLLTINGWDTIGYIDKGDALYEPDSYQRYDSRTARQALLLGRYSIFPEGRQRQERLSTSSGGMDIKQWRCIRPQDARPSQGREQKKQSVIKSRISAYVGTHETSYDTDTSDSDVQKCSENSGPSRPKMAQVERGQSVALGTRKGDIQEKAIYDFSVPSLWDTIQVKRQKCSSLLQSELSDERLSSKRVVCKRQAKSQSVFSIEVEGRAFYLSNGLVSHNCDDLKYLVVSRFPKSEKPQPKAEKKSLQWFERVSEMDEIRRMAEVERHS